MRVLQNLLNAYERAGNQDMNREVHQLLLRLKKNLDS
jgi:hypothetical protein